MGELKKLRRVMEQISLEQLLLVEKEADFCRSLYYPLTQFIPLLFWKVNVLPTTCRQDIVLPTVCRDGGLPY